MTRISAFAAALLLTTSAAFAQDVAQITAGTATWTADGEVELSVTWDGGACDAAGEAAVTASDIEGTDEVAIPTTRTAEMCTMQLAPVTYSGTIAVEDTTTTLAITVLNPDGQPTATGSIEIEKPAGG